MKCMPGVLNLTTLEGAKRTLSLSTNIAEEDAEEETPKKRKKKFDSDEEDFVPDGDVAEEPVDDEEEIEGDEGRGSEGPGDISPPQTRSARAARRNKLRDSKDK
eukprot:TRINITY_DN26579_c0_g1_i4.p2 TRINITY_DN26579_c0_g1~~TRINITY_DN26579_c0_g1_i4.p2  ORF type:complete len:104 (-),score=11.97 TRINITY_DN26579_c0_g1_i4:166-477(-)